MVQKVSPRSEKTLNTYYYEKGFTYGRDGLFELLKKKQPKSHPSKEEIELWLKQQKIAQLYAQTRKGGVTDAFRPTKPWYQLSMDLIDFTNKLRRCTGDRDGGTIEACAAHILLTGCRPWYYSVSTTASGLIMLLVRAGRLSMLSRLSGACSSVKNRHRKKN